MNVQELQKRREEKILILKTKRTEVINEKLISWMKFERMLASAVSQLIIKKASTIEDPLAPVVGNFPASENKFHAYKKSTSARTESSCCVIT